MATHVWQLANPNTAAQQRAAQAMQHALACGAPWQHALAYTGYYLQQYQQGSSRCAARKLHYPGSMQPSTNAPPWWPAHVAPPKVWQAQQGPPVPGHIALWQQGQRGGHRYAKGKNAANYTTAAAQHLAALLGLQPNTPPAMVADLFMQTYMG